MRQDSPTFGSNIMTDRSQIRFLLKFLNYLEQFRIFRINISKPRCEKIVGEDEFYYKL